MTPEEYEHWHAGSIESYAASLAKASGTSIHAARQKVHEQDLELLPRGLHTDRMWLLIVTDEAGADVGVVWIGPHPDLAGAAYVFDLEIHEAHRGRGLGRAAMQAAETLVTEAGLSVIGLNVFGYNEPARRLYESLGYHVVATRMAKTLSS